MPSPSRGNNFMLFLMVFGTLAGLAAGVGLGLLEYFFHWRMSGVADSIFYHIVSLLLPCLAYFLATGHPLREALPMRRLSVVNAALIFFMTICIEPLAMLLASVTSLFAGNSVNAYIATMYDQPFPLVVLAVCVSPALLEEAAMRGVVFSNHKSLGVKKAALMNGLFFGVMHMQLEQFFYAFLLGVIFVYFVYYTKSLWASVLSHFVFNFTQTSVSYAVYHDGLKNGLTFEQMFAQPSMSERLAGLLDLALMSVIFTFAFSVLMYSFRQYNIRRNIIEEMEREEERFWQAGEREPTAPEENRGGKVFTWSFWALMVFYAAFIALDFVLPRVLS